MYISNVMECTITWSHCRNVFYIYCVQSTVSAKQIIFFFEKSDWLIIFMKLLSCKDKMDWNLNGAENISLSLRRKCVSKYIHIDTQTKIYMWTHRQKKKYRHTDREIDRLYFILGSLWLNELIRKDNIIHYTSIHILFMTQFIGSSSIFNFWKLTEKGACESVYLK